MGTFTQKTDYLKETKGLLKDRLNSLGASITNQTTFRDYLVWLDSLYEALEEKTITGLPDSLEGNTTQTTSNGINKFNPLSTPTYVNAVTTSNVGNGVRVEVGTSGGYRYAIYIIGDTTTLNGKTIRVNSLFSASNTNSPAYALIYCDENGGNRTSATQTTTSGNTISTIVNTSKTHIALGLYANNTSTSQPTGTYADFSNIMLTIDNSDMTYIPFDTGYASPSPDHPQPINVVSGRQVVRVCGNQLFDKTTITDNVYLNANGTLQTGAANYVVSDFIPIQPNTAYYKTATGSPRTKYYDSNFQPLNTTTYQDISIGASAGTFTTPNNASYLRITIYKQTGADSVMINKGTSALTYEEYKCTDYEINLGKQLYKPFNFSKTHNSVEFTYSEDGAIKCNGTTTGWAQSINYSEVIANNFQFTLSPGTYTISGGYNTKIGINVMEIVNNTATTLATAYSNPATFIIEEDTIVYIRAFVNNTTADNMTLYPQLEKGSSPSSYSAYKTPIELCKLGDYQDFIRKGTGKNLFDNTNVSNVYTSSASISTIDTGVKITSTATGTGYYFATLPLFDVSNNVGETFTIRANFTTSGSAKGRIILGLCDENGGNRQAGSGNISTSGGTLSYTIPTITNASYLGIWFYVSTGNSVSSGDYVDYTSIELEKGNSVGKYEPYGYKDKWYIHKEIGRVVLNGSETTWNSSTANYYLTIDDIKIGSTGYSNYFVNSTTLGTFGYFRVSGSRHWLIFMAVSSQYSISQWKTWLSTHNVEVYYILNTPTNTLIVDEELINQLNEIEIFTVISEDFYN